MNALNAAVEHGDAVGACTLFFQPVEKVMTVRGISRILATLALALVACTGAQAACTDAAGPGVNWSGCNKNGVRVAGANLSGANLSGALLGPADNRSPDFSNANLSGANFKGAQIRDANFAGANLSGATWTDGKVCATPSIGVCSTPTTTSTAYKSEFYWKSTYGRGVGTVPALECQSAKPNQVGALCYESCREGYAVAGLQCVKSGCPSGYSDRGLTCHTDQVVTYTPGSTTSTDWCAYRSPVVNWGFGRKTGGDCMPKTVTRQDDCRSGYSKVALSCNLDVPAGFTGSALDPIKSAYGLGASQAMVQVCRDGKQMDAGLCYTPCRSGYKGAGPVCWGGTLPGYVDCGLGMADGPGNCAKVTTLQTASVGFLAAALSPGVMAAVTAKNAKVAAETPELAMAAGRSSESILRTVGDDFMALEPVAKEFNTAIATGQSLSAPISSLMSKFAIKMLTSPVFSEVLKSIPNGYYFIQEANKEGKSLVEYWNANQNNPAMILMMTRTIATGLATITGLGALAVPALGVPASLFDLVSNYAYPTP